MSGFPRIEIIGITGIPESVQGDDLPKMSIWEAIKEIRRFSDIPIIVATEGRDEIAVVRALESGADDYIHLPCNLMEVMARVVALVRRVG
ncbi:MAG: response regulator transcription factor, partial [Chloroflexi bacterium]|nr:response regulator transcription factor [Chloroflexota bacterium]